MLFFYILVFLVSCFLFYFLSRGYLIDALIKIAKYLKWREFVVAFFILAIGTTLPNLFVGIFSAFKNCPQLSFGEILSGNVFDLTVAIALASFFAKDGIPAQSSVVQTTSFFTLAAALLPLFLISDGKLSQGDGLLLILFFIVYFSWLFKKEDRYKKIYDHQVEFLGIKDFFKEWLKVFLAIILLLVAAKGIVSSAIFFAKFFKLPISLIGILIVGLSNALPETYFAIISAKRNENWLILGDLMGSVITPSTLVLGIVSLISPIEVLFFSPFKIARIFLIISVILFFIFAKTDRKITKKEGIILLAFYLIFILLEIRYALVS